MTIKHNAIPAAVVALMLILVLPVPIQADECAPPWERLVRLAADRIDSTFGVVAASTQALGEEYARLADTPLSVTDADSKYWINRRSVQGSTTGFRSWPAKRSSPPAFESDYASFYSYNRDRLSDTDVRQLQLLEQLVPVFRSAYRSFDFSWVYFTTVDEQFLIYPYLPIGDAIHNDQPTQQVFYTAADFEQRTVGWTLPYLDLVGAGMMITVSFPVYDGATLLGVASRDITLKQLSKSVLGHLVGNGTNAYIVDGHGLVIDAGNVDMATEVDTVNKKAGAAVLYYRTPDGLKSLGADHAVASRWLAINTITERVIDRAADAAGDGVIRFESDGRQVLSARIPRTGWFVVLVLPPACGI